MNLLLILSALLSALTGVGIGARRPEVAQAVTAQAIKVQPANIVAAGIAWRPVAMLPTLIESAMAASAVVTVEPRSVALWTSRRRE